MIMDLTGFPACYPIYTLDENNAPRCLGVLTEAIDILPLCYQQGVTKLYIEGARPFAEGIAQQIKDCYKTSYSADHYEIEIEVN